MNIKKQDTEVVIKGENIDKNPEELSKGEFININEESGCDKKDVLKETTHSKNFTVKKLLEID